MRALHPFTVRECRPDDAGVLAATAARLFAQAYAVTHPEPELGAYIARSFGAGRLAAELGDPRVRVLLAEDAGGGAIGYAYLREPTVAAPAGVSGSRPLEIVRFYVDAAWHGRGVAGALMAACEGEARRRAADALFLKAWQQVARAIAFYQREGFDVVGAATFRFGDRDDDDYVMARPVGRPAPER
jgi:ribosomal protein S18 acetylase RimI-like enzyme